MAGLIGPAISGILGLGSLLKGPSKQEQILNQLAEQELLRSKYFDSLFHDTLNEGRGLRDTIGQNQQIFAPGGAMEGGFSFARSGITNPLTGGQLPFNSAQQFADAGSQPVLDAQFMVPFLQQMLGQVRPADGVAGQAAGLGQQRESGIGDALGGALQNFLSSSFLQDLLKGPMIQAPGAVNFLPNIGQLPGLGG